MNTIDMARMESFGQQLRGTQLVKKMNSIFISEGLQAQSLRS